MPKPSLYKDFSGTIKPIVGWGTDKSVPTFLKCINLKVNIIVWLEFEMAYYDVTVQHISHCATGTTLLVNIDSFSIQWLF